MLDSEKPDQKSLKWVFDCLVVLGAVLFSAYYFNRYFPGPSPTPFLFGDESNIASIAAALDNPKNFSLDPIFGVKAIFEHYQAFEIDLIRLIYRFTGDYGTSIWMLLPLFSFFHLTGFYFLGFQIFNCRIFGVLFSLFLMGLIQFDSFLYDYWGLFPGPLPRLMFTSLLGWFLGFLLLFKDKPSTFFIFSIICSYFLTWVHKVSSPAWVLAILFGYFALFPKDWSLPKKLKYLGLNLIVLTLFLLPHFLHFFQHYASGETTDFQTTSFYRGQMFGGYAIDPYHSWGELFTLLFTTGLLPLSIFVTYLVSKNKLGQQPIFKWSIFLTLGLIIATMLVPVLDFTLTKYMNRLPFAFELSRNVRFLPFAFFLVICCGLSTLINTSTAIKKNTVLIFLTIFCGQHLLRHSPLVGGEFFQDKTRNINLNTISNETELRNTLNAIKSLTPPGSKILAGASSLDMAIRFYAVRASAFSVKDYSFILSSKPNLLLPWGNLLGSISLAQKEKNYLKRIKKLSKIAKSLKADYIVIRGPFEKTLPPGYKSIHKNRLYWLIKI